MTRQEFIDDVNSYGELISVCRDYGIDVCDDVYDTDYINEIIVEAVRQMQDWTWIKDFVKDIPSDSSYYREDGYGSYEDAEYCFDDYKNDVLRQMDANGNWDEDDDEWDEWIDEKEDLAGPTTETEEEIETDSFIAVLGRAR